MSCRKLNAGNSDERTSGPDRNAHERDRFDEAFQNWLILALRFLYRANGKSSARSDEIGPFDGMNGQCPDNRTRFIEISRTATFAFIVEAHVRIAARFGHGDPEFLGVLLHGFKEPFYFWLTRKEIGREFRYENEILCISQDKYAEVIQNSWRAWQFEHQN
jgi:hypothetical protein